MNTRLPMRLGITTFGTDGGASGIGRYARALITEFTAPVPDRVIELVGGVNDRPVFGRKGVPFRTVSDRWSRPLPNVAWHQVGLPRVARRYGYDVLFVPAGNRRLPGRMACPVVGTVHDLSQLHVPGKYDGVRQLYARRLLPKLIRRLTHVITVSRSSMADIVEYAGVPEGRISVIPNGVDLDLFRPRDKQEARANLSKVLGSDAPFVLYVARLEHPGKNHVRLIQAFDLFKRRTGSPHRLVLAGPDWTRADVIHAAAAEARCTDDILFTGFLAGRDLPLLYSGAEALVFPSLYEGFGIPLLEAMASGTAVAAARCSSLPEVGGDAALYFDPREPEDIAAAMSRLLCDDLLRRRLVARGLTRSREFSWQRTAARTLDVIRDVTGRAA